jgi:CDP-diacylglycerol--glycerol-3-phosphate 3-phosphatidyltransferase
VAAYAQGIFVVLLLFRGYEPTLFYLMIGLSALAYIEEITLVWLLPTWSANVGGLYWVLRK